jgi:hypothetical protein
MMQSVPLKEGETIENEDWKRTNTYWKSNNQSQNHKATMPLMQE